MKKILALALVMILSVQAHAQLLWKVSGKDLSKPSFIMGTHHMAPLSFLDKITGFQEAFNSTNQVVGEVITNEMQKPETIQLMQRMMMIESDTTLLSLLGEENYKIVSSFVTENMGFDLGMMPKVKPAFIQNNAVILLYMKHLPDYNPQEQFDAYFQTRGAAEGKQVSGLETIEFQLGMLFNRVPLQRQAVQLMCLLNDQDKTLDTAKRLNDLYMKQDLDGLLALSLERLGNECDPQPGEMESMIDNRNINWAAQLPGIMDKPSFIVVGALHLPGKNGVINLLRNQGYTVEPVQ